MKKLPGNSIKEIELGNCIQVIFDTTKLTEMYSVDSKVMYRNVMYYIQKVIGYHSYGRLSTTAFTLRKV